MENGTFGFRTILAYASIALGLIAFTYHLLESKRLSSLTRSRILQSTEQILLNLKLVKESGEDDNEGMDIELLKQAPLQRYDGRSRVIKVSTQTDLIEAMKHISEQEWIGVDLEHSKKYAYHGLVCLIQVTVYDQETASYTTYLIDTLEFQKE